MAQVVGVKQRQLYLNNNFKNVKKINKMGSLFNGDNQEYLDILGKTTAREKSEILTQETKQKKNFRTF